MSRLLSGGRAGYISYDLQNALQPSSHQFLFLPYPAPAPHTQIGDKMFMTSLHPSLPTQPPPLRILFTHTPYLRILSDKPQLNIVSIFTSLLFIQINGLLKFSALCSFLYMLILKI